MSAYLNTTCPSCDGEGMLYRPACCMGFIKGLCCGNFTHTHESCLDCEGTGLVSDLPKEPQILMDDDKTGF